VKHSKSLATTAIAGLLGAAMAFVSAPAAAYTAQEQANIKVVADFYDALNARDAAGGESKMPIRPIIEKYLKEDYHQNSPDLAAGGQGREALIKMFQGRGPGAGGPPGGAGPNGAPPAGGPPPGGPGAGGARAAPPVLFIGGQGDMVVRVSGRGTSVIFNMFRVENGKLAEHWDAMMGGGSRGGAGGPPGAARPAGGVPGGGPPPGGPGGPGAP
jgi:predicted SnoaL-like aldol condensation-catalyzing enzyme